MLVYVVNWRFECVSWFYLQEVHCSLDGAPLDNALIDGLPLEGDAVDGCPMGWNPLDGDPVDDIDGVPLGVAIDDIDGTPCECILSLFSGFHPSCVWFPALCRWSPSHSLAWVYNLFPLESYFCKIKMDANLSCFVTFILILYFNICKISASTAHILY